MSIYARRVAVTPSRADDARMIVADKSSSVTRTRETSVDKFRGKTDVTIGPLRVRIEPFRATRVPGVYDEKGTSATVAFILLAVDLPRYQDTQQEVPTFKLLDTLTDQDGNKYRVTSPPLYDGPVVECNLELLG